MNDLDDLSRRYRDWPEVKALIVELREVREAAREVTELFYGSYRPNGKGLHCHMIRGRWDHDGSECVKCAAIQKLAELLWPERDRMTPLTRGER